MDKEKRKYLEFWREERNGAFLYASLAEMEPDRHIAEIYRRMAEVESRHARRWAEKYRAEGGELPHFRPAMRTRVLLFLARRLGIATVLPSIRSIEGDGQSTYQVRGDARDLAADEASHARVLDAIAYVRQGGISGGTVARLEGRHRLSGGNALRAAVLGANDGLVSNLCLVMGVAGADMGGSSILLTGLAGLLAGACSMALGEWLSVQSSRESYQRQLDIEEEEIRTAPQEEAEELALIYQARGLDPETAHTVAARIMADHETALDTLAREELGIDPDDLGGSPWVAAFTSFCLFALGAALPVLPFFVLEGTAAIAGSAALGILGLALLGAGATLFTGRSIWFSAARQVTIGLGAAVVTFGAGHLLGVNLAG